MSSPTAALTPDFSQFIRDSSILGNDTILNCNAIANSGFNAPFFQQLSPQNFQVKNCIEDQFVYGNPRAPTPSGGINVINTKVKRDIFSIPLTGLSNTTVPIATTSIDHGMVTGDVGTIIGTNNLPATGPNEFVVESNWPSNPQDSMASMARHGRHSRQPRHTQLPAIVPNHAVNNGHLSGICGHSPAILALSNSPAI
jgi:hypothetical protein